MNWRSLTYEKAIKKVKVTAKVLRKPLYNYADGKKKFGSENKKLKTTWWYERLDRAKSTCFARVNTAPKLIAYLLRYMTEFFIKEKVSEEKVKSRKIRLTWEGAWKSCSESGCTKFSLLFLSFYPRHTDKGLQMVAQRLHLHQRPPAKIWLWWWVVVIMMMIITIIMAI